MSICFIISMLWYLHELIAHQRALLYLKRIITNRTLVANMFKMSISRVHTSLHMCGLHKTLLFMRHPDTFDITFFWWHHNSNVAWNFINLCLDKCQNTTPYQFEWFSPIFLILWLMVTSFWETVRHHDSISALN